MAFVTALNLGKSASGAWFLLSEGGLLIDRVYVLRGFVRRQHWDVGHKTNRPFSQISAVGTSKRPSTGVVCSENDALSRYATLTGSGAISVPRSLAFRRNFNIV